MDGLMGGWNWGLCVGAWMDGMMDGWFVGGMYGWVIVERCCTVGTQLYSWHCYGFSPLPSSETTQDHRVHLSVTTFPPTASPLLDQNYHYGSLDQGRVAWHYPHPSWASQYYLTGCGHPRVPWLYVHIGLHSECDLFIIRSAVAKRQGYVSCSSSPLGPLLKS